MPLERARMRIRVVLPQAVAKKVRPKLDGLLSEVLDEQWAGDMELVCRLGRVGGSVLGVADMLCCRCA